MSIIESYTHSVLATGRRCLTELDLRYVRQLELDVAEDREVLAVGSCWHAMLHAGTSEGDPYDVAARTAPGDLWRVKLARMYAAHRWYWDSHPLPVAIPEHTFEINLRGHTIRGQIDGVVQLPDGRRGIIEYKTTSDAVDASSDYWSKLRLDVQVGIYALACQQMHGFVPDFIVYDVTRKPTIRPSQISAKDQKRMRAELDAHGAATYYDELFDASVLDAALTPDVDGKCHETPDLYGSRLTSEIGNDPAKYFARREVPRTAADYDALIEDIERQVALIGVAFEHGLVPRNPDACHAFGRPCDFFQLCSNLRRPLPGEVPQGYRRREHLHPELAR